MRINFLPILQRTYAAAGIGLATFAVGEFEKGKAKKQQRALEANRPKYQISPFAKDELNIAESEFSNGMSADAERAYTEGMDSSLSASLNAILKSGGTPNNVSEAFSADARGRQQWAIYKDQQRLQKQQALIAAYRNMTEQGDKDFMYNIDAPFKDKMQAAYADQQSGQNLINSGINIAGSGITSYFSNKASANQYAKYFGGGGNNNSGSYLPYENLGTDIVSTRNTGSAMNNMIPVDRVKPVSSVQVPQTNFVDFSDYQLPMLKY